MKSNIFILFVLLSASAFAQGSKMALQNLSGTYKSQSAEDWGRGTYGMREFSFDNGKWTLNFILALDPEMKNQVFEFRTYGTYKVLGKSNAVEAYEAVFYEDKKYVTLKTANEQLIAGFGLADCGLITNVEKDISEDGCAIWPAVKDCMEDHDLLAMDENGNLFFGVRPADNNMCTADRRPTALLPPVTAR